MKQCSDSSPAVEWRTIPGFDTRYEVSNHGQVRSWVERWSDDPAPEPHILKDKCGTRPAVFLKTTEGRYRNRPIHILMALAFLGPRLPGQVVRHLDDDRRNNTLSNLAYGTVRQNTLDALRNGRKPVGERHYGAKLTWDQVQEIRADTTRSQRELSRAYGIGMSNVHKIRKGLIWRHDPSKSSPPA